MAVASDLGIGRSELSASHICNINTKKRSWDEESKGMLQLMLGQLQSQRQTLDFLGASSSLHQTGKYLDLDQEIALPSGWEKCLDLKTGSIFFVNRETRTSTCYPLKASSLCDLNSMPSASSELEVCNHSVPSFAFVEKKMKECQECTEEDHPPADACIDVDLGLRLATFNSECSSDVVSPARHDRSSRPSVPSRSWASDQSSLSNRSTIHFEKIDPSEAESNPATAPAMTTLGCAKCLMYVMLSTTDSKCPRCGTSSLVDFPPLKSSKFSL